MTSGVGIAASLPLLSRAPVRAVTGTRARSSAGQRMRLPDERLGDHRGQRQSGPATARCRRAGRRRAFGPRPAVGGTARGERKCRTGVSACHAGAAQARRAWQVRSCPAGRRATEPLRATRRPEPLRPDSLRPHRALRDNERVQRRRPLRHVRRDQPAGQGPWHAGSRKPAAVRPAGCGRLTGYRRAGPAGRAGSGERVRSCLAANARCSRCSWCAAGCCWCSRLAGAVGSARAAARARRERPAGSARPAGCERPVESARRAGSAAHCGSAGPAECRVPAGSARAVRPPA
jgi:hypothetical protein